jgi:hypothetical protein
MFGDGKTQGSQVAPQHRSRRHPSINATSRSARSEVFVEQARELADRHTVAHRDGQRPRTFEAGDEQRPSPPRRRSAPADRTRSLAVPRAARRQRVIVM